MTIQGIDERYDYGRGSIVSGGRKTDRSFENSLYGSLYCQDEGQDTKVRSGKTAGVPIVPANIQIRESAWALSGAMTETAVQNISYSRSDGVDINPLEGYTIKTQVDRSTQTVYVECKTDDGVLTAYQVDPFMVEDIENNPVERAALKSWMKYVKKNPDAAFAVQEEVNPNAKAAAAIVELSEMDDMKGTATDHFRTSYRAPYGYLAKDGIIEYNGVTFVCDELRKSICLGDMSDPKNVLVIPLSQGGSLKVNKDNLGDLASAMDMFSPEDINRIMRAIAQEAKIAEMEMELEEDKNSIGDGERGQQEN